MAIFQKELKTLASADVIVCGGGTAGAFAAIAAAESGATVLLLEQTGALGGTATAGLVLPMMKTHIKDNPRSSYLTEKVTAELEKLGGAFDGGDNFDPILLSFVLEKMALSAGVEILYHTTLTDVIKKDREIASLVVAAKGGLFAVEGKFFIDCTGDGDLGFFAGNGFSCGDATGKNQPVSLRYLVGGIDIPKFGAFLNEMGAKHGNRGDSAFWEGGIYAAFTGKKEETFYDLFTKGVAEGLLLENDLVYWQLFPVAGRDDTLAFNNPEFFSHCNGCDPFDLSKTQTEGKAAIVRQMAFYQKYFPGFEKAYLSSVAGMVGVRESRRLHTRYMLTAKDILGRKKFADAICRSAYPVDVHGKELDFDPDKIIPADDGKPYYEIPYACLVAADVDNLLVAGRCVGADFVAQSSLRVQHSCRAMGEAAGIAAAFSLAKNTPLADINGKEVAEEMVRRGAVFGD